jgi:hypothetical protein
MSEECGDKLLVFIPAPWLCHSFKDTYMFGDEPRTQILVDIAQALPETSIAARLQGHVYLGSDLVRGESVQLHTGNGNLVHGDDIDRNGFYSFFAPTCIGCTIRVSKFVLNDDGSDFQVYRGSVPVNIISGQSYNIDIRLSLEPIPIPQ